MFGNRKDDASKSSMRKIYKDIKLTKLAKRLRKSFGFFLRSHICCERKTEYSQNLDYTQH